MKNLRNMMMPVFIGLVFSTLIFGCSKDKDNNEPGGNADEAAAARIAGTYKGTIDDFTKDYFNATIIISKESGNKVKIAPKSGEAYSNVTVKIIPVQAVSGSNDVGSVGPEGVLIYSAQEKTISFLSKATASGDVIYSFEGTKQ